MGGDIPNLAGGVLSFDAIYSRVKDSVSTALLGVSTDANGTRYRRSCRRRSRLTISDNRAVMLLARYTNGPLKLYAGFEQIQYSAPSDPQAALNDIAGDLVCLGCLRSTTRISAIRRSVRTVWLTGFHISWTGVKYAVTNEVDVIAAYYHYNSIPSLAPPPARRPVLRRQRALTMRRYLQRDLRRYRLEVCTEVGCLPRPYVHAIQWRIGERLFREQQRRMTAGLRFRY